MAECNMLSVLVIGYFNTFYVSRQLKWAISICSFQAGNVKMLICWVWVIVKFLLHYKNVQSLRGAGLWGWNCCWPIVFSNHSLLTFRSQLQTKWEHCADKHRPIPGHTTYLCILPAGKGYTITICMSLYELLSLNLRLVSCYQTIITTNSYFCECK